MKRLLLFVATFVFMTLSQAQTVTDFDGNVYPTIAIGSQLWMQENLRTTHYADGTAVPLVNSDAGWDTLTENDKAYCYYNDDSAAYAPVYGALYTWAAAMNGASGTDNVPSGVQGICPDGWHLPSDAEWHILVQFLDPAATLDVTESYIAGGKLKEAGTDHWVTNTGGSNESGFTGLPSGRRMETGVSTQLTYNAMWWSTTLSGSNALDRTLYYSYERIDRGAAYRNVGYAVRCVSDSSLSVIRENPDRTGLRIFPNPAHEEISVIAETAGILEIINTQGIIADLRILQEGTNDLDITSLPAGIYMLRLKTGNDVSVRKVIVEK